MYSEKYMKHFTTPQNAGEISEPDGLCEVAHKDGGCFDRIRMTLRVEDGKIAELKYMLRACSGTIAASSAVTSLAIGKNLDDALKIGIDEVNDELGGVPERKMHSVELAVEALREVIMKYQGAVS